MNSATARWISARAAAIVRLAGTRTVLHRRRTGVRPGLKVDEREARSPGARGRCRGRGRRRASSGGAPRRPRPRRLAAAGIGSPRSLAVHICLEVILAMTVPRQADIARPRHEGEHEDDGLEDPLVDPAQGATCRATCPASTAGASTRLAARLSRVTRPSPTMKGILNRLSSEEEDGRRSHVLHLGQAHRQHVDHRQGAGRVGHERREPGQDPDDRRKPRRVLLAVAAPARKRRTR